MRPNHRLAAKPRRAITENTRDHKRDVARAVLVEGLELRRLCALIGVDSLIGDPTVTYDPTGFADPAVNALVTNSPDPATPGQSEFQVTATPTFFFPAAPAFPGVFDDAVGGLTVRIRVGADGSLAGGDPSGPDFSLSGTVDTDGNGSPDHTGLLLTGEVAQFGFEDVSLTDQYDFRFTVTGGAWASTYFAGKDIGLITISPNSGLDAGTGLFGTAFAGSAEGALGPIESAAPSDVLGSIAGAKYRDLTNNGLTPDDTPLDGVTVFLDDNGNGQLDGSEPSQVTGPNGTYKFMNVTPGTYTVREVVPGGYVQTAPSGGGAYSVTLAATGTDAVGKDFANYLLPTTGSISGKKFRDLTANGLSGDDAPLAGVRIYLDANGNGVWDASGPGAEASVLTSSDGSYTFSDLAPTTAASGPYVVREVPQAGYVRTAPAPGDSYSVAAAAGRAAGGYDFANYLVPPSSIGGTKYLDRTGNGLTADDTPLGGVTVYLDTNGNASKDPGEPSQATAANGTYLFPGLTPGTYAVREVVPAGYGQTVPAAGGYYSVALALTGTDSTGNNFANCLLPTTGGIGGKKFRDLTNNGLTGDDTPLAGVTIFLDKNDNGLLDTTGPGAEVSAVTGADGSYAFANLAPGPYVVREVVPAGYVRTFPTAGDHYDVTVVAGQTKGGYTFANYLVPPPPPTGSLSGMKVRDVTGNGWSADDVPLGGVKIYLDLNKDGSFTAGEPSTLTLADGTYKFAGLAPGNYVVREVVPTGYVRTGPTVADNYAVKVVANADAGGNNFANWRDDCNCGALSCIAYVINGCTVVTDLRGQVRQGDQVTVNFTVRAGQSDTVSLVSYKAPSAVWDATVASQQSVFDLASGTFGPGSYSLTVQVPNCYFQVDFVCGLAIDKLGPVGSNIFYSAQGRLFSADNGGTLARYDNGATISGRVLWDRDSDGVVDTTDTGIGNVTIRLTGVDSAGRTVNLTRTTRSDGTYSFADLRPGRYTISEAQPTGFYDGKEILGTVNGLAEGRIAANDKFDQIDVLGGQQAIGYVFLERK